MVLSRDFQWTERLPSQVARPAMTRHSIIYKQSISRSYNRCLSLSFILESLAWLAVDRKMATNCHYPQSKLDIH